MEGHIKLHRKILDWEWYSDKNTSRLFLHMLIIANWKEQKFRGMTVPRGSFVSSIPKLSEETGLSIQEIKTALNHLKSTGEVTGKITGKYTIFIINNYHLYQQDNRQTNQQLTDNQPIINREATGTKEEEGKKEIKQESKKKAFCPEAEASAPGGNVVGAFILNDGSEYNVTENDMELFQKLYPGIDCLQQLRNITGWCLANPKRRKTRSGAKRFLNNWLAREQNSARPEKPSSASNTFASSTPTKNKFHNFDQSETDYDALMMQKLRTKMAEDVPG